MAIRLDNRPDSVQAHDRRRLIGTATSARCASFYGEPPVRCERRASHREECGPSDLVEQMQQLEAALVHRGVIRPFSRSVTS